MTRSDDPYYLKPCSHCGSEWLKMSADRIERSIPDFIQCMDCGAKVEYDHHRCDDPDLGQIIEDLIMKWNRRVKE